MSGLGLPRILYVTDLDYPAAGRVYGAEDRFVTAALGRWLDITICSPTDVTPQMDDFDAVVVRNSGPVLHYQAAHAEFRRHALANRTKVFNELTGRADMVGKQYLLDLSRSGAAVIPTADRTDAATRLPSADRYIVKPLLGADSIGVRVIGPDELAGEPPSGSVVQPMIDIVHEVSFYFVDHDVHYALYAPDPARRWELASYEPSAADLAFAQWFVDWNTIDHGIQRVDACRTTSGDLLLMELEDLNPYLSLDAVPAAVRDQFIEAMRDSILALLDSS